MKPISGTPENFLLYFYGRKTNFHTLSIKTFADQKESNVFFPFFAPFSPFKFLKLQKNDKIGAHKEIFRHERN